MKIKLIGRIYAVICDFNNKSNHSWNICDFTHLPYTHNNFYKAHKMKRELQIYLQKHGNKRWYKNRFRVVELKIK